ncbi:MAG: GNAT family N-acetyltransferase [Alphaproteobacteria bacterium]|nr:GNAT family N-acetyltransferase [Alphaproteobacteria bacterium]
MSTIFAETPHLYLRAFEKRDLPRYAELIGDWNVAKWLSRVPHPYTLKNAEGWLEQMTPGYESGKPELFVMADKENNTVMGAVGLHAPWGPNAQPGEIVLGYWLGKPYWGQGFMSEAVPPVIGIAFNRPDVKKITVFTDLENHASQNVLRKAGFRYLGISKRAEEVLRGGDEVTRWELTRKA